MRSGRSLLGGLLYMLCRWLILAIRPGTSCLARSTFALWPLSSMCTFASMDAFQKKQLEEKLYEEAKHQDLTDLGALSFEIFKERASNFH